MNYARNCENLLNFVKVIPKTLLVPFFSGHGVFVIVIEALPREFRVALPWELYADDLVVVAETKDDLIKKAF